MPQRSYRVEGDCELLPFLMSALGDCSRTTVKSYLAHSQVEVNRRIVSQFDAPLRQGDDVTVFLGRRNGVLRHPMLSIVYEDDALIVADKRSGLLSMGTDRERTKTAYFILSEHVKKGDAANRIFIVHRLDRDTSGLMIFAKSEAVQEKLQRNWDKMVWQRGYVAVVEGRLARPEGMISTFLTESKGYKVFVTNNPDGEKAVTRYRVLQATDRFSLLELSLETGRKNQIRAHMEYIGHSVAGDRKYGATDNPIGRVALHANRLGFIHPVSGETMDFSLPVPGNFRQLLM